MEKNTSPVKWSPRKWIWIPLVCTNLTLGAILWFGYLTDYSFAGVYPDLIFPPVVGLVGLISLYLVIWTPTWAPRILQGISALPSLFGGCLPTLLAVIMLIPPFTLGFLFAADEITGETRIQQAVSPDRSRVAEVYFRGVGAYTGGNGHIYVRVKYRCFPIVERDIYYVDESLADEETDDYLYWLDDDTLYISETEEEVEVGRH